MNIGLKKFFLLVLLLILSCQLKAYAAVCTSYDGMKVLERNPEAVVRAGEIYSFGYSLEINEKLPALPDGEYVYLIDSHHHTMWSPRIPNLNFPDDAILVTHRALANKFFEIFDIHPEVLAAGEIKVFNGVTSLHWNKASTYLGGKENLDYAEAELSALGLKFLENTKRVDLATEKVPKDHFTEIAEALAMKTLLSDPEIAQAIHQFFSDYRKFSAIYPGSYAGILDDDAFLFAKGKSNYKPIRERGWEQPFYLYTLLPLIADYEMPYAVMKKVMDERGKYALIGALTMFDKMEGSSSNE